MWEVYFDDSGTHGDAEFVVAACYISRTNGWQRFVQEFDQIRDSENFDCFHMADFAARHNKKFKPWCDWEADKRARVYRRIAETINRNKFIGFGFALPREAFDRLIAPLPDWLKFNIGPSAYTFAVRCLMGNIGQWRQSYGITLPMQYMFDRQSTGREEIDVMWRDLENRADWAVKYGMEKDGHSFQDRCKCKPLQAADILAWQMNNHMRNVILPDLDELQHTHPNFRILRQDQEMQLGFLTETQLNNSLQKELRHGVPDERFL